MKEFVPTIKVSFCLTGNTCNIEYITNKLGLIPTKARRKEDFPVQSIKAGVAKTYWCIEIKEQSIETIPTFNKLINILKEKNETINELCQKFNLDSSFIVTFYTNGDKTPIMELSNEIMTFANSINATISFDIYH